MIFITGDTHLPQGLDRLNPLNWETPQTTTTEDILIICGDFGGIWDNSDQEKGWLKTLSQLPLTICFCDGNHENFDLLSTYPIMTWKGGLVHQIYPNLLHLMRGQAYMMEGQRFFVLGGADSIDLLHRVEGVNWWKEEIPSPEELTQARQILDMLDWNVDVVITHTAPTKVIRDLGYSAPRHEFQLFLDEMAACLTFKQWYFGHFHRDVQISSNYQGLYQQILPLQP